MYDYDNSCETLEGVPIMTGAIEHNYQYNGLHYILIFKKSLCYVTTLDHSLTNPNQIRIYSVYI